MSITFKSPVVSVKWLKANLDSENLIVLDGTIAKTFDSSSEQIPTARFFDIKQKFSDVSNPFPSAFPSQKQFQEEAQNLGIHNDSAIVVYDDKGIYSSPRVWWLFKAFGFKNVAVLDGGFPEWKAQNYHVEGYKQYKDEKGDFSAKLQDGFMQFFSDIEKVSKSKTHTIVDARSKERFNGEVAEPRVDLRKGTIPNSINLPYTELLEDGKLKSVETISAIFSDKIAKDEEVIFSCGSGITACVLALGAEISGYKNLSVYDGSWTEYGTLKDE